MKKTLQVIMSIALITMLGACASDPLKAGSAGVAKGIVVLESEYDTTRSFVAPAVSGSIGGLFGPMYSARLAAVQSKKTGAVVHAVVIDWTYVSSHWKFFSGATLPGGLEMATKVGRRDVRTCGKGGCTYEENLTLVIPDDHIKAATPLRMRVKSSGGFYELVLPVEYVRGYLDGLAERRVLPPPAPT